MRESVDHKGSRPTVMLKRNLASIAGGRLLSGDKWIATGYAALDEALGGGLAGGRRGPLLLLLLFTLTPSRLSFGVCVKSTARCAAYKRREEFSNSFSFSPQMLSIV